MQRWRRVRASLVLALIPVAFATTQTRTVHADAQLSISADYTYTVDPTGNAVHVMADMSLRNNVPNKIVGNLIDKTYYSGFNLFLPAEGTNVVATQDGTAITTKGELVAGVGDYFRLDVDFARNLFDAQTAHVIITYDIIGQQPRATQPTRVNAAYAAFNAYGIGDPGHVTVRVVVPKAYTIDTFGDHALVSHDGDHTIYTATAIDDPSHFNLFISARNDGALSDTPVNVDLSTFHVRSWPGDDGWHDFVHDQVTKGIPELQKLVGQTWPVQGSVEIREAATPYLYGYAGWFNADTRQLELGENLDAQVLLHELSHAWFNPDWFQERWISEGLAQEYSALAMSELGEGEDSPQPLHTDQVGAVQLNDWLPVDLTNGANPTETYAYNASWSVLDQIVGEIGQDRMRLVFAATAAKQIAYRGEGQPDVQQLVVDWHNFLDLLDEVGGSQKADALFTKYVVSSNEQPLMTKRTAARSAYDTLRTKGGDWAPPLAVRTAMAGWHFAQATTLMQAASTAITSRDELDGLLHQLDVPAPTGDKALYEGATTDLTAVQRSLDHEIAAAKHALADRDALQAQLMAMAVTPAADFAASYESSTNDVAGVEAALAAIATAAHQVQAASDEQAAAKDFARRVGLYGTDLPGQLDTARTALAHGDVTLATAIAATVVSRLHASDAIGRSRVLRTSLAAGVLVLLLSALVVLLIVRRRRRRRQRRREALSRNEVPPGMELDESYHFGSDAATPEPPVTIDNATPGPVEDEVDTL